MTVKDLWIKDRNNDLYGQLQSWVQTVEDDIKQYEADLFLYMNHEKSGERVNF